jgi:hypothetical protein
MLALSVLLRKCPTRDFASRGDILSYEYMTVKLTCFVAIEVTDMLFVQYNELGGLEVQNEYDAKEDIYSFCARTTSCRAGFGLL